MAAVLKVLGCSDAYGVELKAEGFRLMDSGFRVRNFVAGTSAWGLRFCLWRQQ